MPVAGSDRRNLAHPAKRWSLGLSLLLCMVAWKPAPAGVDTLSALKQLSLEDLANLEVSIASGRTERLQDSAAAVYVLTADDIRRSGATTLPEVLRNVPGLNVARISASEWAVTSRVGNGQYADKPLVMVDGRSVYTPLFSGVMWDQHNIILQDIERIEVVRGPGAATWGANAVNGVINIITRHAEDTQGNLVSLVAGSQQREIVARAGFSLGQGQGRLYAKFHDQDGLKRAPGDSQPDSDWHGGRVGFRSDWGNAADQVMLQGEVFREDADDRRPNGGHLLARWDQRGEDGALSSLQGYFDVARMDKWTSGGANTEWRIDTLDLSYRREFRPRGAHRWSGGAGVRNIRFEGRANTPPLEPSLGTSWATSQTLYSAFVQDDITLSPEQLFLSLGVKAEHNDFTGMEWQPSARLRWSPGKRGTLWAAASRAVRTPSLVEKKLWVQDLVPADNDILPGVPGGLILASNPDFRSETLRAYELGYRVQATPALSLDATAFRFDYDRIMSTELTGLEYPAPFDPAYFLLLTTYGNNIRGHAQGFEISADYRPSQTWRLRAALSRMQADFYARSGSTDPGPELIEGTSPHHQFTLGSSHNLSDHLELDVWARHVGELSTLGVKAYTTLDARIGWRPAKGLELGLVGHNLIGRRHKEYVQEVGFANTTYLAPRDIYLTANWRF